MNSIIEEILNIRYIKLRFTAVIQDTCNLPCNKASALRGGMGEMLLRANCISDRNCDTCGFETECVVQRMMYSKLENPPDFMSSNDSVGYVIECENYEERFSEGDALEFNLILFGKTMAYFNLFMTAFYALGQNGLGKEHARFTIVNVRNSRRQNILEGTDIYMKYYTVEKVSDYVNYRLEMIKKNGIENKIIFKTPLTQKYQGILLNSFNMDAIIRSIKRRIYILACFEGYNIEEWYRNIEGIPLIVNQQVKDVKFRRFSNRKQEAMYLQGIKGKVVLDNIPDNILWIMLAGELIHIGKNTSFGSGRYIIK